MQTVERTKTRLSGEPSSALEPSGCAPRKSGAALSETTPQRLIIGITGASGAIYGVRLLQLLRATDIETHLVLSRSAMLTMAHELDCGLPEVTALADVVHRTEDVGAAIASGSFKTIGMIIAPCSMRSLAEIASGVTSSLVTRAADVVLKERRRLVLVARETPLHLGHLRSMVKVTEMGAIVYPPVAAFHAKPASIAQMVDHTLGRVMDLFDIDAGIGNRWQGLDPARPDSRDPRTPPTND